MKKYTKSIVASGHEQVSRAAAVILEAGGNAFDGVVAAGFASTIVEPALTSLGGGGFMLGYSAVQGQDMFFDFFVDTPGKGHANSSLEPHFFPVTVNFSGSSQEFNVGLGSVAVPGTLRGLLHIHKRLGRMPLREVIEPARKLALGHRLNRQQSHFLELLQPIMTLTPAGAQLYNPAGIYLHEGDLLCNQELAEYLERVVREGDSSFYRGDIAAAMAGDMEQGDGLLTLEDLAGYQVQERKPLRVPYRDAVLLTAPAPSMGGTLIGLSLSLLSQEDVSDFSWGSADYLSHTVRLMRQVERLREEGVTTPEALVAFLNDGVLLQQSVDNIRLFSRGTTHVSIADALGNCASMTCSNGEGSGYFAPGTGIMLNNMMGEDDLHPDGFHASPAGERVLSMMSPSMLQQGEDIRLVIGSGGSKRIRTAVSQVLSQVVDYRRTLQDAVSAPRIYWDVDRVQVEPGFDQAAIESLVKSLPVNLWQKPDVYFGGVHAVIPGLEGAGDSRRGGSVVEIPHP